MSQPNCLHDTQSWYRDQEGDAHCADCEDIARGAIQVKQRYLVKGDKVRFPFEGKYVNAVVAENCGCRSVDSKQLIRIVFEDKQKYLLAENVRLI